MNLVEKFDGITAKEAIDCDAFICPADKLLEVATYLHDEAGYTLLSDATAIDNGVDASPRFTTIYHILSIADKNYIRLVVDCDGDEEPVVPSVSGIFGAANWHERETYDMFGIRFEGHPNMRRILMWDEYSHHPLRKDFPLAGIEGEYPEEDVVERTNVSVLPAPMAGGPFVAANSGPMSDREPTAKDQSWREQNPKG